MFAITGITGQVGGVVARSLLADGHAVRAVVRDSAKGLAWAQQGCSVAQAAMEDAAALQEAFTGVEGVFVLLPPNFDPHPDNPVTERQIAALHTALLAARPDKVVCLSTIGAQASQPNLLQILGLLERTLADLPIPVDFLRAGWFMENAAWDVAPARSAGIIPCFLQPLDKPVPMVATADVGRVAAELLQQNWQGPRVVQLEGPQRVTPLQLAESFSRLLGRPVQMDCVPRDAWERLFKAQGMRNPRPRMQMLDGFNEGWIEFEGGAAATQKGRVQLDTVLQGLIDAAVA